MTDREETAGSRSTDAETESEITDDDPLDADTSEDVDTTGVEIVLVAAVAENGVIGREGSMPWHYPADLEHFRETTMGSPVVMGRRTFESIYDRLGEPLPGRTNVVLTRRDRDFPEGVIRAASVADAVAAARETGRSAASDRASGDGEAKRSEASEERAGAERHASREVEHSETSNGANREAASAVYVVGGGAVYEQFLPLADRLVVTEIHDAFEGDTRFPDVDWSNWTEVEREDHEALSFVTYERRR